MIENILYIIAAFVIIALLFRHDMLNSRIKTLEQLSSFYSGAVASLGLLTVAYDVGRDEVRLSWNCAFLLGVPGKISKFAQKKDRVLANPQDNLYPIALCLTAFEADVSWQMVRRGQAPRRFEMRSFMLQDNYGRPQFILGVLHDITQQANEEARLAARANFDELTHLYNSSATRSWMKQHIGRPGESYGMLILLDVDHFKSVNDTIGHQGGDQALVFVASALRRACGGHGFLGRLGGDEFTAFLYSDDVSIAKRICRTINRYTSQLAREAGLPVKLTVSIGCAMLSGEEYEQAYKKADEALYAAKAKGRDTYYILLPAGRSIPHADEGGGQA